MKQRFFFIRCALLPLTILMVQVSFAQLKIINNAKDAYRAVHWSLDEGLSQGQVEFMIKDINGFLWMGTGNGLNRFDGRKFKIFFHDPGNPSSISDNTIVGLVEDSLHNIWAGTTQGLSRYDIRADTFTNFIPKNALFNKIQPLWATRNEVYCLEADLQITMYNVHSFKKKNLLKLTPSDKASVVFSFFDTATNSVWMPHGAGLEAGLLQISLTDGTKKNYSWPTYKNFPNPLQTAPSMCYDKRTNSFWINSSDGLIQFTLADKKFHHIDVFNDWVNMKDYYPLGGIAVDKEGRVWLPTHPKGIIIYDPSDESVKLPFNNHPDLQKEISYEILYLYIDKEDIAWTGYWSLKGFYQLIPSSTAVTRYAADTVKQWANAVANFLNADHGRLWFGTSQGLQAFDPHTGLFQLILTEKDLPGIKGNGMLPVAFDTLHGKAWFLCRAEMTSQFGSLYEMDVLTGKCRPVIFKDLANHIIPPADFFIVPYFLRFNATPFRNGCVVGAVYNNQGGAFIVNEEGPVAKQILAFPGHSISPWISTDGEHFLFMISKDSALNFSFTDLSGKWMRTPTPFDSIKWNKIVYNKSDLSYWVVGFQQLMHYDKSFKLIKRYTLKDGLPEFEIYGLGPDNNGNIWFNTDRSIYQLNIETGKITVLSEKDGFLRQTFTMGDVSRVKDEKGDIYFPAGFFGNGFDKISPDKFFSSPSFVYAQSIEINQTPISLSTGINNIGELSLRYFQNNINVGTGIIDYYSKGESRIRYRLEGLDTNWQYGPHYYTIRYERLPPAKYKLVMQASNAANEFNGPEKILIIHISPPFWQTWWFRIIAVTLIILSIYGFIQYRSRNLRQRNIKLEEKVLQRTNELNNSLTELKSTQAQLIQSEKMASLGELTAGIAHEIQNPLNFVNNFSELNTELIEEMENEIDKDNIEEIKAIVNDIKKNEKKINHHGKRADAIVKGMLEHSRTSIGIKAATDINALADEYLRLAYHGLRAKDKSFNATMKTDFDESIGKINIIPPDIGRVLLNLYNNAFYAVTERNKQQPDGHEPIVSVSTKKIGNKIEIIVRDNGNGIPQKALDKIFQPFFTTKPTGQGTGLGLSLSYDIIKAHRGEIKVETKEGEYTVFIILLPSV